MNDQLTLKEIFGIEKKQAETNKKLAALAGRVYALSQAAMKLYEEMTALTGVTEAPKAEPKERKPRAATKATDEQIADVHDALLAASAKSDGYFPPRYFNLPEIGVRFRADALRTLAARGQAVEKRGKYRALVKNGADAHVE